MQIFAKYQTKTCTQLPGMCSHQPCWSHWKSHKTACTDSLWQWFRGNPWIRRTYIYLQKSGNFQFQRRAYSLHKGRPFVKPIVVVTTTGYFIAILGPYMAKPGKRRRVCHSMSRFLAKNFLVFSWQTQKTIMGPS